PPVRAPLVGCWPGRVGGPESEVPHRMVVAGSLLVKLLPARKLGSPAEFGAAILSGRDRLPAAACAGSDGGTGAALNPTDITEMIEIGDNSDPASSPVLICLTEAGRL